MDPYNPQAIEPKWQGFWRDRRVFHVENAGQRPKFYVLDMFPYPSGTGLHVGHPRGYVASDVVARFKRMQGYDVLHPMGWDSFGLPTERQADKEGIHPAEVTSRNIETFRTQLQLLGLSYDWEREFATSHPDYYKWTQWIFLKLYERGLAYQAEVPVNWCPALNTVLANEEVQDGAYVETGDPVERRLMRQWMLRITAYAERLLTDLDLLDWPEGLKEMQRNWIGRSEGARVTFRIAGHEESFEVYTTRPDTLFGCTYCVLAPEHPLVARIVTPAQKKQVEEYLDEIGRRSERERIAQAEVKTGVYTGGDAICPVNGARVPIWIADYVLASYGTGAVFGCPAHDERDHGFAKRFQLPIVEVVKGGNVDEAAYTGDGEHVNSEFLNGLNVADAKARVIQWLEEQGSGKREIQYALRDWLFSRQRYWGEPIPMIATQDGETKPVPEESLPVVLPPSLPAPSPEDTDPAPLGRAKDWVATTDPETGRPARRETNTMPQWAGSSWYFLRFADAHNDRAAWSAEAEKRWMPVDLYVGGAEHATLHLLYARFWHKVLYDMGYVSTPEPFMRLFNQGMVLSRSFRNARGKYLYPREVAERDGEWFSLDEGEPVQTQIEKMSKSRYNVVSPEEVIAEHGADSLRIYEVFMGPMEDSVLWQTEGIAGVRRFLDRAWRLFMRAALEGASARDGENDPELERLLHKVIRKVTSDIDGLQLNTAISQLMIFVNEATKKPSVPAYMLDIFARLLAPFAPHAAEELWRALGYTETIAFAPWPEFDPVKCIDDAVHVAVQVDGKVRGRVVLPRGASEDEALATARRESGVNRHLENRSIAKTFFVPDRLLSIVTS
jgi:leucyl-tRNA synthetase